MNGLSIRGAVRPNKVLTVVVRVVLQVYVNSGLGHMIGFHRWASADATVKNVTYIVVVIVVVSIVLKHLRRGIKR